MRTMSEILNLFVDGKIKESDQVTDLLCAETSSIAEHDELRKNIAETAMRLLPSSQANRIVKLLKGTD